LYYCQTGESVVWRNITKCKELIRQGIAWTVGNGQDISFWRDNWIENRSLLDLLEVEDQETFNSNLKVSEFIEDKQWNVHKLGQYVSSQAII